VLPILRAKGMPNSDKIKYVAILSGYGGIDRKGGLWLLVRQTADYGSILLVICISA